MSAQPLVLVVEDEPKLAALLCDYLHASGYATETADTGTQALARIRMQAPETPPPDAVLLDLMLPELDGLSVCRAVRASPDPRIAQMPILMLTARVDEIDRLLGLELGADDYICKPFSPREVVARVKAVLRRAQAAEAQTPSPLHLDDERLEARVNGALLPLTPVEFRLLQALHTRPGRVMSRTQLIESLYLDHRVVSDRTVDSHIKNLRRKIVDSGARDPLISVYGVGYKLDWDADA
ncbi:MAG: response regulator [Lysobacter sp.]|nr:response regulator [Lysobacter sp.]